MANEIRTRPPHKDIKLLDRTEAAISHIKEVKVLAKKVLAHDTDGALKVYSDLLDI